jgi:hypothetical protein
VLTGQSLKNALLGGVVSGGLSYLSPDITKGLGIGGGSSAGTSTGGDGFTGINVVGSAPASIGTTLGGSSPSKLKLPEAPKPETPYDGLTVTGGKFGTVGFGGDQFGAPGSDTSAFEKMYNEPYDPNEILVKASPLEQAAPVSVPVTGGLPPAPAVLPNDIVVDATKTEQSTGSLPSQSDLDVYKRLSDMENAPVTDDIVVTGNKIAPMYANLDTTLGTGPITDTLPVPELDPTIGDGKKLGVKDYLEIASLLSGLIPGGGGGSGQSGTYGGGGTGRLNPIFSAKLPSSGGLGVIGANRTARPMGDVDWLTYGTRPELNFYDYAAQNNPAPITTPVPNNPAGPIMEERDPMAMAKGGRTEFAVNGAGTGRSDDIPAVLSDGEYVIDAETVALLGDGSSKAGAKKLDELRVKVRKHKGQKLAKGRFSANAKRPEAYLSGGRI